MVDTCKMLGVSTGERKEDATGSEVIAYNALVLIPGLVSRAKGLSREVVETFPRTYNMMIGL